MKTPSKWVAGLAGMALLAGTGFAQSFDPSQQSSQSGSDSSSWSNPNSSSQQLGSQSSPSISRSDAESTALGQVPGGRIQTGGLARENGKLVWSFDVFNPSTQNVTEVSVDAFNGNLVAVQQESGSFQGHMPSQYGQQFGNQQQYSSQFGSQQSGSQGYYSQQQQQRIQTGQFVDSKRLLGQEVNNQQGQTLGQIKDVVINTQNGQVFTILGIGNNQNAIVPVQALNISGIFHNPQVTLNATKQALQSGPVVQNNRWLQALNNPGFTQRIYSHYNMQLQPGSEVGVVIVTPGVSSGGGGNLGGSSTGSSSTSDSGQNNYPSQGSGAYDQESGGQQQ